jgi:SAM-dependent methyltransferase
MAKIVVTEELEGLAADLSITYPPGEVVRQMESLREHGDAVEVPDLWLKTAVAHRFKHMPIERVRQCICGSHDHEHVGRFIFWNLLGLRECRRCGVLFVSPRLTQEAMARIFNEVYFSDSDMGRWGARREPVFEDVMRYLRRLGCRTVFDVGAAYGHFVHFATQRGMVASGCDVSATAVARGREIFGVDLHAVPVHDVPLPDEAVDAVVSLDTLYYSGDPVADLRAMRRLVRRGGHVILRLRTSRRTLARARREGRKEVGRRVLPGEHIWAFTAGSVAELARAAGLDVLMMEPATYSRNAVQPLQRLWTELNRAAARHRLIGIRTRSYNAVLQRPA